MITDIFLFTAALFAGMGAIVFFFVTIRVANANKSVYERNRQRIPSLLDNLRGRLARPQDGQRDSICNAGIVVDRSNRWVEQAKLSDESISNILSNTK
jgi:hypothetical protein